MKRAQVVFFCWFVFILALTPAGSVRGDSMSSEISVAQNLNDEFMPDVVYNSVRDEYFVVWYEDNLDGTHSIIACRYTSAGVRIQGYAIDFDLVVRDNIMPSVAFDPVNDRYLVVWVRDFFGDGSDEDIYGRFVPWDGPSEFLPAFVVDNAIGHQWSPRVAYGGDGGAGREFMVTWWNQSPAAAPHNVSAQRIAAAGGLVGSVIDVTSDPVEARVSPDIAYNRARNEYIIAYHKMEAGGGDIYGVRLSGAGAVLGGGDFGIAGWPDAESAPRIAASRVSNIWAVAWHSQVDANQKDVFARTVSVDGTGTVQVGDVVQLSDNAFDDSFPDIGAHPESSNFLISWQIQYSSLTGDYGIWSRVLHSGGTLGAFFETRALWVGETTNCGAAAVTGGVNDWMVVWQHARDGTPVSEDIHGRILFAGILEDGFESSDTTGWSSTTP